MSDYAAYAASASTDTTQRLIDDTKIFVGGIPAVSLLTTTTTTTTT